MKDLYHTACEIHKCSNEAVEVLTNIEALIDELIERNTNLKYNIDEVKAITKFINGRCV